jgi:AraC-like DNA-binding protein
MLQSLGRYRPPPGRVVLPDVCCDIAIADGRLFFTGALTQARPSQHVGKEIVLLRIGIAMQREILGVPLAELTDRVVPLDELNRSLVREVVQRLETNKLNEAFGGVPAIMADARFVTAARALANGRSVGDAAARVALGARQLDRLFADRVGVSPKMFARIVRFRRAAFAARGGTPLAIAAAEAGYADQPHFTREVRALTGRPPLGLLPAMADVASVQDVASWRDVGCT